MFPKITFIVPVYNIEEEYLRPCLQSIISQTLHKIEIIIVNNGSTNRRSMEIIDEFARYDSRIRVVTIAENRKFAGAVTEGIAHVRTKYFTVTDGDDVVHPALAETALRTAEENDADLVVFDFFYKNPQFGISPQQFFDKWSHEPGGLKHNSLHNESLKSLPVDFHTHYLIVTIPTLWNKLFKTEMVVNNKISFFFGHLCEDNFFSWSALSHASKIVQIPDVLYWYVNRPSSMMTTKAVEFAKDGFLIMAELRKQFMERGVFDRWRPLFHLNELELYAFTRFHLKNVSKKSKKVWYDHAKKYCAAEFIQYLKTASPELASRKSEIIDIILDTVLPEPWYVRYSREGIKRRIKKQLDAVIKDILRHYKPLIKQQADVILYDVRSTLSGVHTRIDELQHRMEDMRNSSSSLGNGICLLGCNLEKNIHHYPKPVGFEDLSADADSQGVVGIIPSLSNKTDDVEAEKPADLHGEQETEITEPYFSVIVPFYRETREQLEICLNSILGQSYPNIELLCVSNGANPELLEYVQERTNNESRIKLIVLSENKHPSGARNAALDVAAGRYVLFVDADDRLLPDALQSLADKSQENDCDITVFNILVDDAERGTQRGYDMRGLKGGNKASYEQMIVCSPVLWSKLWKRSFIERHQMRFDTTCDIVDDALFCWEAIINDPSVCYDDIPFYHYVTNLNSTTSNVSKIFAEVMSCARLVKNKLHQAGKYEKYHGLLVIFLLIDCQLRFNQIKQNEPELADALKKELAISLAPEDRDWIAKGFDPLFSFVSDVFPFGEELLQIAEEAGIKTDAMKKCA